MKEFNYESDVEIDIDALDSEWLNQPSRMLRYVSNCAKMEKVRDEAKEALELCKSTLDKEIREHPEKYNIDKITDKVVEATIIIQKSYKEASQELIDAKYELNIAKGVVDVMDQRKSALENLVKLHGQGYFAGPVTPRNTGSIFSDSKAREEREKSTNAGIGSKLGKRRTK